MWQGRRWAGVALSAAVAATLCLGNLSPALAGEAGTQVLGWKVEGAVEAGGMWSGGERGSNKFNDYRDMDNGFLGELSLQGEKKDSPYHFNFGLKNPARDDQSYEGGFGRYGMFTLDLGWDRVRHVLANNAQTMFQESGDFTLPSTLRATINTVFATAPVTAASRLNTQATILGLGRSVDLGYNTDVGFVGFKLTPTESLRFDLEYNNRRNEGTRAASTVMVIGGTSDLTELAIPIDQTTHEAKLGVEFAQPNYGLRFNYTGSFFENRFQSYRYDDPVTSAGTLARGELSAAPDNQAHTFSLTGRGSLPWWRTNISGNFSYSMLRQDETLLTNVAAGLPGATNADSAGRTSADAKANLVAGNIVLTSRPFNSVTATARYRYFEYQNDSAVHSFVNTLAMNGNIVAGTFTTGQERFTKQNGGLELGWRPVRQVAFKGGYEYEHWSRGGFDGKNFGTDENTLKASMDVTPVNWILGRMSYTYGNRNLANYGADPLAGNGVQFLKFNYADRVRNRADVLLQFSRWDTFTPSFNFGYAVDNFNKSAFGLTDDQNISAGTSLSWTPLNWLTVSADYTYERHDTTELVGNGTNPYKTDSKDEFHTVGLNTILDIIPKKLDLNFGYNVTLGYTTIHNNNLLAACAGTACVYNYAKIQNVLQTVRAMARYRLTENLSIRGGIAYERFNERNFARDPMLPFMGFFDTSTAGAQSVWLGATTPNYESYTIAGFVRYEFK